MDPQRRREKTKAASAALSAALAASSVTERFRRAENKHISIFACRGGPRRTAPPNRGPRGTQKLVRTITTKNDDRNFPSVVR